MKTITRKINKETVVNPLREYARVWSFRTQRQMDLWINEMQGQISDGMWENCRNTDWLWKGEDVYILNPSAPTKLVCLGGFSWERHRTSFPMTRQLVDCISERIYIENGFVQDDLKELRKEWSEVLEAIQNATWDTYSGPLFKAFVLEPRERAKKDKAAKAGEVYRKIQNELSDLIEIREYSYGKSLHSKELGIFFDLTATSNNVPQIKISKGSNTVYVGKVEDIRRTVEFLQSI